MGTETVVMDNPIIINEQTQINVVRSEPLDIGGVIALGFSSFDAAWTAADLVLEVSPDRTNWVLLTDAAGNLLRLTNIPTAAAWMRTWATPAVVMPFRWARLVSINTASTSTVSQGAPRNVIVSKLYDVQSLRR